MSTAEAEYVSLSACCAQVIWMRTQLLDYGYKYNRIPMYCDSKSAIAISCNPVQHSKTKHIDIRYHFIKEHVEKGTVEIYFVGTEYQLARIYLLKRFQKNDLSYLVHRPLYDLALQLLPPYMDLYETLFGKFEGRRLEYRRKFNVSPTGLSYEGCKARTPSPLGHLTLKWMKQSQVLQNGLLLAEHKSREEQEAGENVELVNKHLATEEIEKMMEGLENVEITNDEEVEITNVVILVNVNEEEEEITDEVYKLKRRERGKIVEESRSTPFPTPIRSPRIHTDLVSSDTRISWFLSRKSFDTLADHLQEVMLQQITQYVGLILERQKTKEEMERMIAKAILQEHRNIQAEVSSQIQNAIDNHIPSQVDASVRSYMSGHILHVLPVQSQTPSVPKQQYQLYLSMKNDTQLQQQNITIWLALQMKFENLQVPQTTCRPSAVRPRDHDDPHPEGENSAKWQKTSEYEAYVSGESLSGQVNEEERDPSTLGNQEQVDDYDFWTDSYASDDDEIPTKQVSQDIMEEVSLTIDEAKLKKMADEMLRQRCTSRDEHQYHINQMKNFLKSDIVPQGKKSGAKIRLRRKQSSKHTSESKTKASKSKTGQSEKDTQSSSAKDKSSSHPSPPTLVVGEMHKDTTSSWWPNIFRGHHFFHLHSESTSGHKALADSTAEADPGLFAPNDSISS
ncbi:hypothetical protein Tco_0343767 [Tanacetum coccineum]